jgi:hypothetical protein
MFSTNETSVVAHIEARDALFKANVLFAPLWNGATLGRARFVDAKLDLENALHC